ncbi:MAG: VOC family protein [Henriciella sp.]|jgi:catechol 2,3-dioxygenase-like lactoylglutathione lyase family enzyme|nr:VOC family protein [Henriciella sp.]
MIDGINGLHHIAISTGRWDQMLKFYRDTLGFAEVDGFEWRAGDETSEVADAVTGLRGSGARVAMLKGRNACIELFEYYSPEPKPVDPNRPVNDHGLTHICLDVTDVEAVYNALLARGMRFHTHVQEMGDGIRGTYGRDPDGNVVEIQELLKRDDPARIF